MRVLVVTRRSFADAVVAQLQRESVYVEVASELARSQSSGFAVVVVELGVADWRPAHDSGASVLLFADHADCDTISTALAAGVDDVITRGDRPHEVVARIRAVARRRATPLPRAETLLVGGVELDPAKRSVTIDGRAATLTQKQFDLLEFFLRNAGRVVTRSMLLEHVWDMAAQQDVNAVEVQVRRLREAIGDDLRDPSRLRTVRGVGYIYERAPSS